MTSTDYLHFAESFFKDCIELSRKKTADYTGNGEDAFANFRQIPENWTEIGFLTRMGDKMARLRSFVQNGDLQVKDESATDTLRDLANYCSLFAAYLGEQKEDGDSVRDDKPILVEIVSRSRDDWYFDKLYTRFMVVSHTDECYKIIEGRYAGEVINKGDCKVISNSATNP